MPVLFTALFLFGVISALFGPIKYGILPDHLAESELPAGNALVEGATFIAILIGTIVGGLASKGGGDPASFAGMMMAFAARVLDRGAVHPARPAQGAPNLVIDFNIARSTAVLLRDLFEQKRLWWGGLVVSWFWLVGAVVLSLLPPLVKNALGGGEEVVTAYLAVFSIAIAIGSGLAAWLASGRIVLMPTVFAGVLLGLFALDLGWVTHGMAAAAQGRGVREVLGTARACSSPSTSLGLAIAGGLFIVPAFSAVQAWAGADRRARVVAAVNVLNAAFMTAAGVGVAVLQKYGVSPERAVPRRSASPTSSPRSLILRTMPTNPLRDLLSVIFRAFFRLEVTGLENIAKAGPNAIIALNHVSFLDAAVALSLPRSRAGLRDRQHASPSAGGSSRSCGSPARCRSIRRSRSRPARSSMR